MSYKYLSGVSDIKDDIFKTYLDLGSDEDGEENKRYTCLKKHPCRF